MVNRNERTLMLGGKIKRLRDEKNISLDELANNANVDKNTISRIEKGLGSPSLDTIVNISHALKVSPEKLLGYGELREKKDYVVFRREERKNIPRKGFMEGEMLEKLERGNLNASIIIIPPGQWGEIVSHPGEELLFCLSGKLGVKIRGTGIVLEKGEAVLFYGTDQHCYYNALKNDDKDNTIALSVWIDPHIKADEFRTVIGYPPKYPE